PQPFPACLAVVLLRVRTWAALADHLHGTGARIRAVRTAPSGDQPAAPPKQLRRPGRRAGHAARAARWRPRADPDGFWRVRQDAAVGPVGRGRAERFFRWALARRPGRAR